MTPTTAAPPTFAQAQTVPAPRGFNMVGRIPSAADNACGPARLTQDNTPSPAA